jgi:hypothetical protein
MNVLAARASIHGMTTTCLAAGWLLLIPFPLAAQPPIAFERIAPDSGLPEHRLEFVRIGLGGNGWGHGGRVVQPVRLPPQRSLSPARRRGRHGTNAGVVFT